MKDITESDWSIMPELPPKMLARLVSRLSHLLREKNDTGEGQEASNEKKVSGELETTLAWGRKYLPNHFSKRPSKMHQWLSRQLGHMKEERGVKVNLIGPRGGAKSTVGTLGYALRAAVEGWEPYIWIVSDTKQQAQTHLENIKVELEENELLSGEYPAATGRGPRWRAMSIELKNGVVIESYGTGQRIRGRRRGANRPTLILCDDLQNDDHISSATQREASRAWFHGTLLKAGTVRTNIVQLATALHRDALAMQLMSTPGWRSARFQAIEQWPDAMDLWEEWNKIYCNAEDPQAHLKGLNFYKRYRSEMEAGAVLLWPEEEDLYALMQMRVESGHSAFEREKQSSPVNPELCEWPESYFKEHIWFEKWPKDLVLKTVALDPSKGKDAKHGDYSAFIMLGIGADGMIYVDADLVKRPTPQIVQDGIAICKSFKPKLFGVEANQFQELLADEFEQAFKEHGLSEVTPCAIHNYTNKILRIRRLGPLLSQQRIKFMKGSKGVGLVLDQLKDFPVATHDDGPDAMEMALRLAEEYWNTKL